MKIPKIPEATITRLSVYSRYLAELDKKNVITISSNEIAEGVGVSSAQVRKDLAYFGEFGTRGVGYNVKELHDYVIKILGLDQEWRVVMVGAGRLGTALSMYEGFKQRGFKMVGIFDVDPNKIGQRINDIEICPIERLEELARERKAQIGVITVPASEAQRVADTLIKAGVTAILNFAPRNLNVPLDVEIRNVDLAVNLEVLTFNLAMKTRS